MIKKTNGPRKPRVIKLDGEALQRKQAQSKTTPSSNPRKPRAQTDLSQVSHQAEADFDGVFEELDATKTPTKSRRFSWGALFITAAGAILMLGLGLTLDQFIKDMFQRHDWLGWVASGLTALLALAAFVLVLREIWGVSRLNTISRLRAQASLVQSGETPNKGQYLVANIAALYASRPDLATARAQFERDRADILDGQDLLALFETSYMRPIDERARALVMQSAKRVSVVTAISPRAIVDILYVLMENTRLIRQISQLYGARPGALGFWKLTRNVLGHLAVTGVIAAGDSLIQQFVGHGLAARLSSKLGEGVVNGLLTARIGIAAMDQARPLEFEALKRPSVSQYFSELSRGFNSSGDKD